MTRTSLLFPFAIALAGFVGCYTGPNADLTPPAPGPTSNVDGTEPPGGEDGANPDGGAAAAAAEGLPCDVAKILATSCTGCHGARLKAGAPNALVTYEDLVAKSDDDPSRTVAEVSLERMKSAAKPMPPEGPPAAADVAVFEKWVTAGTPRGACGTKPGAADAGGPSTMPPGDAGGWMKDGSAPAPTVCTSGTTWVKGTPASPLMLPGKTCIACHSAANGPAFTIAGTVYPTLHEPDSCNGIGGGSMSVLIIDATGKSHTMPVNAAGNFTRVTSIPMPYKAMIVNGTKTREMKTPQTDGDCNGCHTEQGNRSPGRIMAP